MFIKYNPEWEGEVDRASGRRTDAPYRYSETLIMLATVLRVGIVQYRQIEGPIGKMIGEFRTPSFSQFRKWKGV